MDEEENSVYPKLSLFPSWRGAAGGKPSQKEMIPLLGICSSSPDILTVPAANTKKLEQQPAKTQSLNFLKGIFCKIHFIIILCLFVNNSQFSHWVPAPSVKTGKMKYSSSYSINNQNASRNTKPRKPNIRTNQRSSESNARGTRNVEREIMLSVLKQRITVTPNDVEEQIVGSDHITECIKKAILLPQLTNLDPRLTLKAICWKPR